MSATIDPRRAARLSNAARFITAQLASRAARCSLACASLVVAACSVPAGAPDTALVTDASDTVTVADTSNPMDAMDGTDATNARDATDAFDAAALPDTIDAAPPVDVIELTDAIADTLTTDTLTTDTLTTDTLTTDALTTDTREADVADAAALCPPAVNPLRVVDLATTQRIAVRASSTVSAVSAGGVQGGLVIDSGASNAYFVGRAPTPRLAACRFAEQVAPSGWVTTWCPDQLQSPTDFVANRLAALGATAMLPASTARMSMGQVAFSVASGAFVVSSSDVATQVLAAEGPSVIAPSATSALVDECIVGVAPQSPMVDVVFVVDDSMSMGPLHAAFSRVTIGFFDRLTRAGIDWRAAAVTTSFYSTRSSSDYRLFTTSSATARCWFTSAPSAGTCAGATDRWFGTSGNGVERGLQSAQIVIGTTWRPATATPQTNRLRQGAQLVLIVFGDADDDWTSDPAGSIANVSAFFNDYDGAGSAAVVHAIVCPAGQTCGETQNTPRRFLAIADATAGIKLAITDSLLTTQDQTRLIAADIIAHAGTRAPPNTLGHSVRSSGGTCASTTAPHDGFAWFSHPRARLGTSLSCLPAPGDPTRIGLARWAP